MPLLLAEISDKMPMHVEIALFGAAAVAVAWIARRHLGWFCLPAFVAAFEFVGLRMEMRDAAMRQAILTELGPTYVTFSAAPAACVTIIAMIAVSTRLYAWTRRRAQL